MQAKKGKTTVTHPPAHAQTKDLTRSIFLSFILLSAYMIFHLAQVIGEEGYAAHLDFMIFHLVGEMIWNGQALDAYSIDALSQAHITRAGPGVEVIPWAYPPVGNIPAALVSLLPPSAAFATFISLTYGGFLWVLYRLSRGNFPLIYILVFPTVLIVVTSGQNGFLTATLAGAFALLFLQDRRLAGMPLGLLIIKPHLAIGLIVFLLLKKRWDIILIAAVTAGAASCLATLWFGIESWSAFLGAAHAAGNHVVDGSYPYGRMTSLFSSLASLGLESNIALLLHGLGALIAIGLLGLSHMRAERPATTLGFAMIATLAISPYGYDYDMPIFALGMSMILPAVTARARPRLFTSLAFGAAYWVVAGTGFSGYLYPSSDTSGALQHEAITFAGLLYLAIMVSLAVAALRKHPETPRSTITGTTGTEHSLDQSLDGHMVTRDAELQT